MSCQDHNDHADSGSARRSRSLAIAHVDGEPRVQRRSLEELEGSAEFKRAAAREFPPGASELPEDSVSRRSFVQLLGASVALSGAAACQRPNQKIVPYVRRPPEVTPGNALHFATAHTFEGYGRGLVVDSYTGRPTKVEGNPDHPDTIGAATAQDQAILLGLYDPDRARQITHRGRPVAWRTLLAEIAGRSQAFAADGGARLRFLVEPGS